MKIKNFFIYCVVLFIIWDKGMGGEEPIGMIENSNGITLTSAAGASRTDTRKIRQ